MHNLGNRPNNATWLVVIAVLAVVALLVSAVGVSAQETDPLAVVQRFVDARNAGDVAGAMALVADDMRFVGGPICTPIKPCIGKDERGIVQLFIDNHAHLTILGTPQVSGSQVKVRTEVSDDRSRAAGVDQVVQNTTVEVRDGKMVSWVSVPDASDPQTAKFLAFQQAQAAQSAKTLPAAGEGGLLASPLTVLLVGGIVLVLGLVVRRAVQQS